MPFELRAKRNRGPRDRRPRAIHLPRTSRPPGRRLHRQRALNEKYSDAGRVNDRTMKSPWTAPAPDALPFPPSLAFPHRSDRRPSAPRRSARDHARGDSHPGVPGAGETMIEVMRQAQAWASPRPKLGFPAAHRARGAEFLSNLSREALAERGGWPLRPRLRESRAHANRTRDRTRDRTRHRHLLRRVPERQRLRRAGRAPPRGGGPRPRRERRPPKLARARLAARILQHEVVTSAAPCTSNATRSFASADQRKSTTAIIRGRGSPMLKVDR